MLFDAEHVFECEEQLLVRTFPTNRVAGIKGPLGVERGSHPVCSSTYMLERKVGGRWNGRNVGWMEVERKQGRKCKKKGSM